jgi:hypothetical protein
LAIAAIVVVAVVVLALFVTGVLPGSGSSSKKSYGANLPYSEARPLADGAAAGAPGGPWNWSFAEAVDIHRAISVSAAVSGFTANSPWMHYLTSTRPNASAFNGSIASGFSPLWLFVYTNGTTILFGPAVLIVVVVNGTAIPFASGMSPTIATPSLVGHPTMDSPAVMALAVTENSSYINAHPVLNATLSVAYWNDSRAVGWVWEAAFTTCPAFEPSYVSGVTNGSTLVSLVNDSSDALLPGGGVSIPLPC